VVVYVLNQLGVGDDALVLSYAIVYHLVAVFPIILMGSLAVAKTKLSPLA
jgi:hypothetical protein